MSSVTARINQIKQPTGGFIKPKEMTKVELMNSSKLYDISLENVHASLVGLAVDYLTRFMITKEIFESFQISMLGAGVIHKDKQCCNLLYKIKGLDDSSIESALKVVGFDVCFRAGPEAYKPVSEIQPNKETIENVKTMVNRSLEFFKEYGPVILNGFTFKGAYTSIITSGDGDYLTKDTLWDFKVSRNEPTNKHTLQLLIYLLMGKRSIHEEFKDIKKIGIFNPRLNAIYTYDISNLPDETIKQIETDVIGYKNIQNSFKPSSEETAKSVNSIPSESKAQLIGQYVNRDIKKANSYLIKYGPEIEDISKTEIRDTIIEAEDNIEESIAYLSKYYYDVALDDDVMNEDPTITYQLLIEAIIQAERLYAINPNIGSFLLSEIFANCPAIISPNGEEDYDADAEISKLKMKYLKESWERNRFVRSGEDYAFWLLMPFNEHYDPKEGISVLKELEKMDEKKLSPLFYKTFGQEYLSGEHINRDVEKAKAYFQKAYDKGDKGALKQMDRLMKKYRISESTSVKNNNSSQSVNRDKQQQSRKKQGCYIATCVYGSYDCPEVWVLRRYRDYNLSRSLIGKLFIKIYYFFSPKLVALFGQQKWFKNIWKRKLDKMVMKYKKKGYSDSPYND